MKSTDFNQTHEIQWCPGCGDFGILLAAKNAFANLGLKNENIVMVSGIGCSGKIPHYVKTYGFEGLHGRSLPPAQAIKLVNSDLEIVVFGGDGDGYGIGMGHLVHAMRRNMNLLYVVHNNQVYGLTKGQASPTTEMGATSSSTPKGVIEEPINPMTLALASDATWIARGFAGDIKHLTMLIEQGIQHKGFALLDVFQPCVTYNKINTFKFFQDRVYKLEEDKTYNPTNKSQAFERAQEWGEKIPIGVLFREDRLSYEEHLPQLKAGALVKQSNQRDISALIQSFS